MRKTCLTLSSSDQESVLEFVKYVFEFHGLVSIIAFLRMDVITDPYVFIGVALVFNFQIIVELTLMWGES